MLDLLLMLRGMRLGFEFKCVYAPTSSKSIQRAIEILGLDYL